jgi:hypothetical protein
MTETPAAATPAAPPPATPPPAAKANTGPNDVRRVVWAEYVFLFYFSRIFYMLTNFFLFYLGCIYVLKARGGFGWEARTKTTPDVVVWATGTCFCRYKCFF